MLLPVSQFREDTLKTPLMAQDTFFGGMGRRINPISLFFFKGSGFIIYQGGMMNPRDLLIEGEHGDSRRSYLGLFCLIF